MKKILIISFILLTGIFIFVFSCSGKDDTENGNGEGGSKDPVCGNGIVEGDEVCDSDTVSCWKVGHFYPETTATCLEDCSGYDKSRCVARDPDDKCGNGVLDHGETCEMGDKKSCLELDDNFTGGYANCNRTCTGWDPSTCERGGTSTCAQIMSCAQNCSNESCIDNCISSGSSQGKERFTKLYACYSDKCPSGADKEECMIRECFDDYYNCYPNKRCGNGVIEKEHGEVCEQGDTIPCEEFGDEWRAINDAVCNSTCTAFDTYSCVHIDDLTCYEVYECVMECEGDSECKSECEKSTFVEAKNRYDTMWDCYEENCPDHNEECIKEHCKFQTDACLTQLTCPNGIIDEHAICKRGSSIDCGEVKDSDGEPMYEAGTGDAYCNTNCTEWDGMLCYKFCSCPAIKACVAKECGDYKTADASCVRDCENLGNYAGKNEHRAWREFIENCSSNGDSGFDSQHCIDRANQDFPCNVDTPHDKCPYN